MVQINQYSRKLYVKFSHIVKCSGSTLATAINIGLI